VNFEIDLQGASLYRTQPSRSPALSRCRLFIWPAHFSDDSSAYGWDPGSRIDALYSSPYGKLDKGQWRRQDLPRGRAQNNTETKVTQKMTYT